MLEDSSPAGNAKTLGAYYTDAQVADFLVQWAIRSSADTVLDPAFGGGVFLRSACKRLRELDGDPSAQVHGVEIDASVHSRITDKLADEFGLDPRNLRHGDFF
ncbi:MAG: N-6 DNA methylase, partial [Bryobacteraceae bacterium]